MMNIGKKRLPTVDTHDTYWGYVEAIKSSDTALRDSLSAEQYETKTRGRRKQPAARPCGEGKYALLYVNDSQHLTFSLSRPQQPGKVQRDLNIPTEGSFALNIKNPDKSAPDNADLPEGQQADYPKSLQQLFRDRRFADEDPRLLDYEGAQFVLVGARDNPEASYGVDLPEEQADAIKQLRLNKEAFPTEPLTRGRGANRLC